MTDDTSPQMQSQMFHPQSDFRGAAAPLDAPFAQENKPLFPTPYTAFYIEPCARAQLAKTIGAPSHAKLHGDVIPFCFFASNPEIVDPRRVVAKGVVNGDGIEIVLCEINNQGMRKDGVPYHMIWSVSPELAALPVVNDRYSWPVSVLHADLPETFARTAGQPLMSMTETRTYDRAVSEATLAAEALATHAMRNPHLVRPLHAFIGTKSTYGSDWTIPPTVMVTHDPYFGGRRRATAVHLG